MSEEFNTEDVNSRDLNSGFSWLNNRTNEEQFAHSLQLDSEEQEHNLAWDNYGEESSFLEPNRSNSSTPIYQNFPPTKLFSTINFFLDRETTRPGHPSYFLKIQVNI